MSENAFFHPFVLTHNGILIRQHVMSNNEVPIIVEFTRGVLGEGRPKQGDDVHLFSDLVQPVLDVPIKTNLVQDINHIVSIVIHNGTLDRSYNISEIGIFVRLINAETKTEIIPECLYGYTYTDSYDYIPFLADGVIYKEISFNTVLLREGNFQVLFDSDSVFATMRDLLEHISRISNASTYGHAMASSAIPLVSSIANVGIDNGRYAREGHIHPAQTNITGNAGTATRLATARTISLSTDVLGSVIFDGSTNANIVANIANNAINTNKILNLAVTTDKVANRSITGSKLFTSTVANRVLAVINANSDPQYVQISQAMIANNAVGTNQVIDRAITGAKIQASVALADNPTTTTQASNNNSTRIATTAFVRNVSRTVAKSLADLGLTNTATIQELHTAFRANSHWQELDMAITSAMTNLQTAFPVAPENTAHLNFRRVSSSSNRYWITYWISLSSSGTNRMFVANQINNTVFSAVFREVPLLDANRRLTLDRLPTSTIANRVLAVTTANSNPQYLQVAQSMIANNAVGSSQIANRAVIASKLFTSETANRVLAVSTANSDPQYVQISQAMIANNAVGTNQIANGAVGTAKIANNAVGIAQLATATIPTATTLAVDTWRNMPVIGLPATVDFNTLTNTGIYQGQLTTTITNAPTGISLTGNAGRFVLHMQSLTASRGTQTLYHNSGRIFHRARQGATSTWTAWREIITTASSGVSSGISITGNAATATRLATARTLALSGNVTGSVIFDGSANATINATIANNAITTARINNLAVTADKVANRAITAPKLFTSTVANRVLAVSTANSDPQYLQVAQSMIANNAVGTNQIANGAVSTAKIANNAVGIAQLATATIPTATTLAADTWRNMPVIGLPATVDFNTLANTGIYQGQLTTTITNAPAGITLTGNAGRFVLHMQSLTASRGTQTLYHNSGRIFHRARQGAASTWTTWREIITTASSGVSSGISITGNAATATRLATARTLALSGNVTGSVIFDGSVNATINATIANNAVGITQLATATIPTATTLAADTWRNMPVIGLPATVDLNTIVNTGIYQGQATTTVANGPSGITLTGTAGRFVLHMQSLTASRGTQTLYHNSGRIFHRARQGAPTTWAAWREIISTASSDIITSPMLSNNAVITSKINNLAVTEAKLAANAVTNSKIANNAITADKIFNCAVLNSSVAFGSGANALSGEGAVAIGVSAQASSLRAICIGNGTRSEDAISAVAIGNTVRATGVYSVGIGWGAVSTHSRAVCIGENAVSTTTYQFLLGGPNMTPFAYRALSILSDERDKSDITDLTYDPLEFINKVQPKQFIYDNRSDYIRYEEIDNKEFESLDEYTKQHNTICLPLQAVDNEIKFVDMSGIISEESVDAKTRIKRYSPILKTEIYDSYEKAVQEYKEKLPESMRSLKLVDDLIAESTERIGEIRFLRRYLEPNGDFKHKRKHNGVIAQQVKTVADEMGFDFAGFKDHSVNGGDDLCSITYEEFIAPMIGAIQQLTQSVESLKRENQELRTLITLNS